MPHLEDRKYYFLSSTFVCVHGWFSRISRVSLCWWIYVHTHTILQIIGARFLLGLLATLVNYCTANFGMKPLANFAHPCYFQLRLTVLAGCLPCLGKPLEAQLSKDSEPSLSPPTPEVFGGAWARWWKVGHHSHFHRERGRSGEPGPLMHPVMKNENCFVIQVEGEESPEKHECKNPQDRVSRWSSTTTARELGHHTRHAAEKKGGSKYLVQKTYN